MLKKIVLLKHFFRDDMPTDRCQQNVLIALAGGSPGDCLPPLENRGEPYSPRKISGGGKSADGEPPSEEGGVSACTASLHHGRSGKKAEWLAPAQPFSSPSLPLCRVRR